MNGFVLLNLGVAAFNLFVYSKNKSTMNLVAAAFSAAFAVLCYH